MGLGLAFRAFWRCLTDRNAADRVETALSGPALPAPTPGAASASPPSAKAPAVPPGRSDALTLLATLQRESRLVDLVMQPLTDVGDADIGAAARDVLRDARATLDRLVGLTPIRTEEEGTRIETPADLDGTTYKLTGKLSGQPPYRGELGHHGWRATRCELPQYTGPTSAANVIAPVELDVTA